MSSFRDSIRDSNSGAYLLYLLAMLFFVFVSSVLFLLVGPLMLVIPAQILGILGSALLWRWAMGDAAASWPSFRLRIGPLALLVTLLASIATGLLANVLMSLLIELSPALKDIALEYAEQINKLILEAEGWQRALGIIGVTIVAPICEELLFRGTILQEQRKKERVWIAVVVNGVLFALVHVNNPVGFVGLAIIGVFLAHITVASGSILPAILAHAAINTTNAVILPEIFPQSAKVETEAALSDLLLLTAGLSALVALLWRLSIHLIPKNTGD